MAGKDKDPPPKLTDKINYADWKYDIGVWQMYTVVLFQTKTYPTNVPPGIFRLIPLEGSLDNKKILGGGAGHGAVLRKSPLCPAHFGYLRGPIRKNKIESCRHF